MTITNVEYQALMYLRGAYHSSFAAQHLMEQANKPIHELYDALAHLENVIVKLEGQASQ